MRRIVYFATANDGKFREAKAILKGYDIRQAKIELPELQGGMEHVAKLKARAAYDKVRKPVFVDDVGLAFHALHGMPGIYIKHFLEAIGHEGLINMLNAYSDKGATAYASIGFCDGKCTKVFIGSCEGKIVQFKGRTGFGWDPIFQPEGHDQTFAAMPVEEKNKISHRRKALEKLRAWLENV